MRLHLQYIRHVCAPSYACSQLKRATLQELGLKTEEILQLINLHPKSEVELYLVGAPHPYSGRPRDHPLLLTTSGTTCRSSRTVISGCSQSSFRACWTLSASTCLSSLSSLSRLGSRLACATIHPPHHL